MAIEHILFIYWHKGLKKTNIYNFHDLIISTYFWTKNFSFFIIIKELPFSKSVNVSKEIVQSEWEAFPLLLINPSHIFLI